jgi:hypothetical protein
MKLGGSGAPLPPVDSFLRATNQEVAGSSPAGPASFKYLPRFRCEQFAAMTLWFEPESLAIDPQSSRGVT